MLRIERTYRLFALDVVYTLDEFWSVSLTLIPTVAIALLLELRLFRDQMKRWPAAVRRVDAFLNACLLVGLVWASYVGLLHLAGVRQSDSSVTLLIIILGTTMIQILLRPILFHVEVAFGGRVPLRLQLDNVRQRLFILRLQLKTNSTRRLAAKRRRLVRFDIGQQRVRQLLAANAGAADVRDAYMKEIDDWVQEREEWIRMLDEGVRMMERNMVEIRQARSSAEAAARMEAEKKALAILEREF